MKYQGIRKTNALFRQEEQYCCASKLSNMRVLGLQLGTFRSLHRPEALCFGAFWRLGRAQAEVDCRLRGVNRTGGGVGLGSGQLESIDWPRRGSGRCAGGQTEHIRILAITVRSSMAAMIFKAPPRWGHCSISISNTGTQPGVASSARQAGRLRPRPAFGWRSYEPLGLALGASTPWKRKPGPGMGLALPANPGRDAFHEVQPRRGNQRGESLHNETAINGQTTAARSDAVERSAAWAASAS